MSEDENAAGAWTPPAGEGWVAWRDVVYMAENGVPRGYALRQGKALANRQAAKNKTGRRRDSHLSDEQRGMRHVAHTALNRAVRSGFIERKGGYCRLIADPVRSQRPWMDAVYAVLGSAHPSLTGRWEAKPPKTLTSVMQGHLGRKLFADEFVRRLPGRGASWDHTDMEVCTRLRAKPPSRPSARRAFEQFLEERQANADRTQEWKHFHVELPKDRRA